MADLVQVRKKIALLHRHQKDRIKETNAAYPFLEAKGIDVLTFKRFNRSNKFEVLWKSLAWIFYAPFLVLGKGYDVIYCDDSWPFYPAFVKLASPKSKLVLRIGDFHLMYHTWGIVYHILHFFEKMVWRMADGILPISKTMGEFISNEVTIDNINVILDPVNPNDFPIEGFRNYGSVMFHGVLTRNKNVDILIEAARLLPHITFIIIGHGPDYDRLRSIAPFNVWFKGWIPFKQIHRYIASCAVGVALRSDNPGNQYVVTSPFLQYGVMGKPCLVTRREVFGDYRWQFSDVKEMATKINLLMEQPEEGLKLREFVLKNHNAEQIAEEIWSRLSS